MKECPSCFHENPDGTRVCEECGYEFATGFGSEGTRMAPAEITAFSKGDLISGRYRVVRELGRGGMGVVYLVSDTELRDERVAVKMIHPHLVSNPEAWGRFADEVLISQKLSHRSIVRVHDLKRWEGFRFFTMEYVKGQSLSGWLERRNKKKPPFKLSEIISVMNPLLDALTYAHQYTIHRDVKPENIMVTGKFPDIEIKVLDFGIAKTLSPSRFTHTAQALGTAYYIAPEQMRGEREIDPRADLYSVGMILYEMLMGDIAVGIPELPSRVYPELPGKMDEIVGRLLKGNPNDRYPDAQAVKDALADAVESGAASKEHEKKGEEDQRKAKITALIRQAHSLLEARRWPEAEELLCRVLKLVPGWEQAKTLLQKTRETDKKLKGLLEKIDKAEEGGDHETAIAAIEAAAPLSHEEEALQEKKGRLKEALEQQRRERTEKQKKEDEEKTKREAEREKRKKKAEETRKALKERLESERQAEIEREAARKEEEKRKEQQTKMLKSVGIAVGLCLLLLVGALAVYQYRDARQNEPGSLSASAGKLFVKAEPQGSSIRLLNISFEYRSGMELKEGQYHIEVSHPGYDTVSRWVSVTAGENNTVSFSLKPSSETGPGFTNHLGMTFVYIKPGSFMMGSPEDEPQRDEDEQQHRVALTKGFYLQTTEVTQGQWKAVMESDPSEFKDCGDDCPVEYVSWNDVHEFIQKLNGMQDKHQYRLPTEAEWEYACRAGSTTPFSFGRCISTDQANYDGDNPLEGCAAGKFRGKKVPVGSFSPNAWGLYDMHGNVREWCQDRYDDYSSDSVSDPEGPYNSPYRVSRGGSWCNYGRSCRSAARYYGEPDNGDGLLGFRLACGAE